MTVYELIQKLTDYPPDTEILFKCIDDKFVSYDCNFQYKKILNELHIELE